MQNEYSELFNIKKSLFTDKDDLIYLIKNLNKDVKLIFQKKLYEGKFDLSNKSTNKDVNKLNTIRRNESFQYSTNKNSLTTDNSKNKEKNVAKGKTKKGPNLNQSKKSKPNKNKNPDEVAIDKFSKSLIAHSTPFHKVTKIKISVTNDWIDNINLLNVEHPL